MRLFTAVELSQAAREHITGVLAAVRKIPTLQNLLTWSNPDNFHITLKFIGEVPDDRVPLLVQSLKTLTVPPMPIQIERFLVLPGQGPARVLAASITRDLAPIISLFNQIESACQPLGVSRERREYKPHLTFGRFGRPNTKYTAQSLIRLIDPGLLPAPSFSAMSFTLFKSQLTAGGAIHTPIERFESQ